MPGYCRALLLLLLFGVSCVNIASATSCAGRYSTLQEDYDEAGSIILAQVTGCADQSLPVGRSCPDQDFSLTTLEVLKDSVPSRDHNGNYQGAGIMGCGMNFAVGDHYLLFLDQNGELIHFSSGYLNVDDFRAIATENRLNILRQYRDGVVTDLSEPWRFTDNGLACSVEHNFKGGSLHFSLVYTEKDYGPLTMDISRGPDGEMQFDAKPYPPGMEQPKAEFTGPTYAHNAIMFSVSLIDHEKMVAGTASVKVDDQVWSLNRAKIDIQRFGNTAHTIHMDLTGGGPAIEILEAMNNSTDVVIAAVPGGVSPTPLPEAPVHFYTKTTQLPDSAKRFNACVDGTERRGNPLFP